MKVPNPCLMQLMSLFSKMNLLIVPLRPCSFRYDRPNWPITLTITLSSILSFCLAFHCTCLTLFHFGFDSYLSVWLCSASLLFSNSFSFLHFSFLLPSLVLSSLLFRLSSSLPYSVPLSYLLFSHLSSSSSPLLFSYPISPPPLYFSSLMQAINKPREYPHHLHGQLSWILTSANRYIRANVNWLEFSKSICWNTIHRIRFFLLSSEYGLNCDWVKCVVGVNILFFFCFEWLHCT